MILPNQLNWFLLIKPFLALTFGQCFFVIKHGRLT